MITIRYNRRALCMGDDIYNGVYEIRLPDDAALKDLVSVMMHGGNGNGWPLPQNHGGWVIHTNAGVIAHVSPDQKSVQYCDGDGSTGLAGSGIEWAFGEYEGEDPERTALRCRTVFGS